MQHPGGLSATPEGKEDSTQPLEVLNTAPRGGRTQRRTQRREDPVQHPQEGGFSAAPGRNQHSTQEYSVQHPGAWLTTDIADDLEL